MQKRVERYTLHNNDDADDNGIVTGEAATTLTSHPSEGSTTSGSATRKAGTCRTSRAGRSECSRYRICEHDNNPREERETSTI